MKEKLLALAEKVFRKEIGYDEKLLSMNSDISVVDMVYFFMEIEKEFGVDIPLSLLKSEAFNRICSIGKVLEKVTGEEVK